MDAQTLAAELRSWAAEYAETVEKPLNVPDGLWKFLSRRMVESGRFAVQEDWDVVRLKLSGEYRKARITSRNHGRLGYEFTEGIGFGLCMVDAVHQDDRSKLADILDKLEGA